MLAAQYQLAFKNVYEFRAFMGMKRNSCAGLESNDLHLQAIGDSHILDKHSGEEIRWLPRKIVASRT
jgi:hypothetical protein